MFWANETIGAAEGLDGVRKDLQRFCQWRCSDPAGDRAAYSQARYCGVRLWSVSIRLCYQKVFN